MENKIILSICIPTYNRADKLKISLNAILLAAQKHLTLVEVIVSDNCSDDNTQEVVMAFSKHYDNLFYFRNSSNLGFNKNLFLLTDSYAKGKYCWVIGDDDYIDIDSITKVINILQSNEDLRLLVINFRYLTQKEYELNSIRKRDNSTNFISLFHGSFANAVESLVQPGNLLGTFMSCHIFFRCYFSEFSKDIFSEDSLENFFSLFPNAYIIATQFINVPVAYTLEPMITCVPFKKDWEDKMQYINYNKLPELYDYYLKLGYLKNELKQSRKMIVYVNLYNSYSNILSIRPITKEQMKYCLLSIFYPSIYFDAIKRKFKITK